MIVQGLVTGMHRSAHHGLSVEFAQHRQYAPGDDTRHLDWKVYARTDKLHLKQHLKETNLDILFLVDCSDSMAYASQPAAAAGRATKTLPTWRKFDHAAGLTAALAYMALNQRDRVGLILFADTVLATTRMSSAQGQWHAIMETLTAHTPEPEALTANTVAPDAHTRGTDLARLFDQVLAKHSRRSLLVLVSDLFDDPDAIERSLAQAFHRRHDVVILQVLDPAELTFPFRAPADFIGLEDGSRTPLDPPAIRAAYIDALQAHLDRTRALARRFHFDYLLLDSSKPLAPALSRFLARRAAVLKHR